MRTKWTLETCKALALEHSTKIAFLKAHKAAYSYAYRHEWLDSICAHMTPVGDKFNRCIYAYEFPDKVAYIGLTGNLIARHRQHLSKAPSNNSAVREHLLLTNSNPKLVQLTEYIHYVDAAKREGEHASGYISSGWTLLNKGRTGSLGASNIVYTKEKCKEIIDQCRTWTDLYKISPRAVQVCKENGWFTDELEALPREKKPNGYWTKQRCMEVAASFTDLQEFLKTQATVYRAAIKNGWLPEVTGHMKQKKRGYWTKELCYQTSLKHENISSFQKHDLAAYKFAYKEGWIREFFEGRERYSRSDWSKASRSTHEN